MLATKPRNIIFKIRSGPPGTQIAHMEVLGLTDKITDPGLPLASLHLLVPPLQLCSAAMWQLAKQKDVLNYHKLQEFVSMVTAAVPGLINQRQRAQLILGLRARLILELCRETPGRGSVNFQLIHSHLEKLPITSDSIDYRDAEVRAMESTFIALVQSLLKDPVERAYFFQEVFPVEYGPNYDGALHVLLWELLSKLEKLFPVPDLKQTAAWLGSSPSILEECVQSSPEELSSVFEHYKNSGLLKMPYGPSSTIGSCIFSALSIPPSQKTNLSVGLQSVHNYANILNPVALVGADQCTVVAVYTEVEATASDAHEEIIEAAEVHVQTDCYEEEIEAVSVDGAATEEEPAGAKPEEAAGETADVARALETLTKAFALRRESLGQEVPMEKFATKDARDEMETSEQDVAQTAEEGGRGEAGEGLGMGVVEAESGDGQGDSRTEEGTGVSAEAPPSEVQQPPASAGIRRSTRLQMKTSPGRREKGKPGPSAIEINGEAKMSRTEVSPTVIAIKGTDKGDSDEMTSMIFTCSRCSFHESDANSAPHFHMQRVRTDVYRNLLQAKFTPTPSAADEIFTSIKLFPKRNAEDPDDAPRDRKKALTCETCGKTFTRTSDVKRHQLTHTGERPFRCSQCERTFQHSWDLAKHRSKHHDAAVSFDCPLCRAHFANLRALAAHHKAAHGDAAALPQICSICGRSFPTAGELLEHRRSHDPGKRYACRRCGEAFDSLAARSQHGRLHRARRHFKCPHCDKTYTRRSDVTRHLSAHTGRRPHQCGQCGKRFSLRFMLAKHLRVHTGERPFQCPHCPKRFTLASVLARHQRMHTGERPFLCAQCGKAFLSQGELSKHQRSHVDDRPFSCQQCGKRFKSKKTAQEHAASHAGARPYPCGVCGKGFAKPYALVRHNLIHTGERPFPCGHCDKSFLTPGEARLHRRVHTGERPYACALCQLKFRSSSELARHRRGHAGSAPRRAGCGECGKAFASRAKLRKHGEEEHGGEREVAAAASLDSVKTEELQT